MHEDPETEAAKWYSAWIIQVLYLKHKSLGMRHLFLPKNNKFPSNEVKESKKTNLNESL